MVFVFVFKKKKMPKWTRNFCIIPEGLYKGKPSRGLMKSIYRHKILPKISSGGSKTKDQKPRRRTWGLRHGKCVDKAIERWAKSGLKSRITCVKLFISWCDQNNFQPIDAQVCVLGRLDTRVATCVDLILKHTVTEQLVAVEVKTGYLHNTKKSGSLPFPLQHLGNTSRNHHCIQAVMGAHMYQKTFKKEIVPMLVYLRDNGRPDVIYLDIPHIPVELIWDKLSKTAHLSRKKRSIK